MSGNDLYQRRQLELLKDGVSALRDIAEALRGPAGAAGDAGPGPGWCDKCGGETDVRERCASCDGTFCLACLGEHPCPPAPAPRAALLEEDLAAVPVLALAEALASFPWGDDRPIAGTDLLDALAPVALPFLRAVARAGFPLPGPWGDRPAAEDDDHWRAERAMAAASTQADDMHAFLVAQGEVCGECGATLADGRCPTCDGGDDGNA